MQMPGRSYSSGAYRFGFNGKENDDEVKGDGNSLDFGARIYDPRVGRFLSRDIFDKRYSWQSPYAYIRNNPIFFVDINGEGDPLASMKIRNNQSSNLFGMVRTYSNGTPKPHQGWDLYAPTGTQVLAVKDATVVAQSNADYGKSITLKITNADGTVYYAFVARTSQTRIEGIVFERSMLLF